MLKRIGRISQRIIEYPKILRARAMGLQSDHLLCCLTAKDLVDKDFKTIIDIGANKGVFIDVCNYLFPYSKIYAFEPLSDMFERIKSKKNVTAFNFGLWDRKGYDTIYYNQENIGASSFLKPTKEYTKDLVGEKKLIEKKAQLKRFDELKIPIERPCFVKIDVEGAEEKVLRGFGDRLKEVDVLQIEWFFREYHEGQTRLGTIMPFLEKQGFVGFIQREVNFVNNIPSTCDLIFFKSKEKK